MSGAQIYVDIDDVLSKTVERLIELLKEIHDRTISVDEVRHFHLGRSFDLDDEEIQRFMEKAHRAEVIESLSPNPGAAETLAAWKRQGHGVTLVTGRPPATRNASLRWLETHLIQHDALHHLDKWSRPSWNSEGLPALQFDEIPSLNFEFAVEDSLETAVRLVEEYGILVALMDRPWNRDLGDVSLGVRGQLVRCSDWLSVAEVFANRC